MDSADRHGGALLRVGSRARLASGAVVAALTFSACSATPTATLSLTTGEETDALSRSPAPTTLVVESLDLDGKATELARAALPTDTLSLGDQSRTDIGALRVRALDAAGTTLLKGETLYVQFGALENTPLEVFLQRTGELARLPRGESDFDAPRLGITTARYVTAASGTSVMLYDLLTLKALSGLAALPRPAQSLVTFGTAAIVIDDAGATTVDITSGDTSDLAAPAGGTFAEIAGGATVAVPDGTAYVVGGTRTTGDPSARVLVISAAGAVSFATLATPRKGACATWVDGRGLVVVGGSATGAGAEILAPASVQSAPTSFTPDPVTGCGASALDASHVLVAGGAGANGGAGGDAPARVLDLACAASCTPAAWPGTLPLVRAEAATLAQDAALVAGDDATGATRVFRVSAAGVAEILLKAPRRGARLIALPVTGTVGIVGGAAPIEQYVE